MKDKLLAVLAARRALAAAVDDLAAAWSDDLENRNRPERQKLTTELVNALPAPVPFGGIVYEIADVCSIEL